ncbi:ATP-binding cassette domain-containing protein [Naasia aerilata]|uniref:ABC transporter ATP-binding protein n=1 Tax=Naasia aerilata TaxID=1162966 RepID=A0ABN6XMM3_9MICO|nr:ATP-binding cassette domain-containing protein [Naasia aerilata]BDZ46234.1 ABC transporter ATP-binding protein [Naasia aerilata]
MIEAQHLTKRYGSVTAVDDVSFLVRPGQVTGFLGPNGAGKSTTFRALTGLDRPSSGRALINGAALTDAIAPLSEVGVLLDAGNRHPGRTARAHLRALAATNGISDRRVDEVMELTGIASVSARRAGSFSLGMSQRLGLAAALLGDPATLILDEPINGLDPDGVIWVRHLLRSLAAEGRTVFLSSHLMSEMAVTADHLIVIGRGRILADAPLADVLDGAGTETVEVQSPDADRLALRLPGAGVTVTSVAADRLEVTGRSAAEVAALAAAEGALITGLTTRTASLEDAYLALTHSSVDYAASAAA